MDSYRLSERLKKVAEWIERGNVVADIGTDHGYLPIYIVKQNISDKVIAMDVRKGPLNKAYENVQASGTDGCIDIRLSDGLARLNKNEASTITICGMGGPLIQSILEKGKDKYNQNTQLIVSPQSEIREFRKFLYTNGFEIKRQTMLKEDRQFYLIIDCRKTAHQNTNSCEWGNDVIFKEISLRYGKSLLEERNKCLYDYLKKEQKIAENVYNTVSKLKTDDNAVLHRINQLKFDMECIEQALTYYK